MIELKFVEDPAKKQQLLQQMGLPGEDVCFFQALDRDETLGAVAFCLEKGQAVVLDLQVLPGMEALLGDGLLRGAWNYCSLRGIEIARFSHEFPMAKLQKLEFFKDFGHEEIEIEKFFSQRKKCGQTG